MVADFSSLKKATVTYIPELTNHLLSVPTKWNRVPV